jgi:hypothetical protein
MTSQTEKWKGYNAMTELEKVEKLREKANVSFAEAKDALENSNGDVLDALIYLEEKGKVATPTGGGFYSGADPSARTDHIPQDDNSNKNDSGSGEEFADLMRRFGAFCLKMFNKGINNYLEAKKGEEHLFSCPILIVILLVIFFFWVTIPLFVISLFCGFRYRFKGADLGRESVNAVMDSASNVVEDVKKSFTDSDKNKEDKE